MNSPLRPNQKVFKSNSSKKLNNLQFFKSTDGEGVKNIWTLFEKTRFSPRWAAYPASVIHRVKREKEAKPLNEFTNTK